MINEAIRSYEKQYTSSSNKYYVNTAPNFNEELERLKTELKYNMSRILDEKLHQTYGRQEHREGHFFSANAGNIANYRNEDLDNLKEQMERNLYKHLEDSFRDSEQRINRYISEEKHSASSYSSSSSSGNSYNYPSTYPTYTRPSIPSASYVYTQDLQNIKDEIQRQLSHDIQSAVQKQSYHYDTSSTSSTHDQQIVHDRLMEELKRNLTAKLEETLRNHYGNQGVRGGYSYTVTASGSLSPNANYNSQDMSRLTQQLQDDLTKQLENQLSEQKSSSYSKSSQWSSHSSYGSSYPTSLNQGYTQGYSSGSNSGYSGYAGRQHSASTGHQGYTGLTGQQGYTGLTGHQGYAGLTGNQGYTGSKGEVVMSSSSHKSAESYGESYGSTADSNNRFSRGYPVKYTQNPSYSGSFQKYENFGASSMTGNDEDCMQGDQPQPDSESDAQRLEDVQEIQMNVPLFNYRFTTTRKPTFDFTVPNAHRISTLDHIEEMQRYTKPQPVVRQTEDLGQQQELENFEDLGQKVESEDFGQQQEQEDFSRYQNRNYRSYNKYNEN